MIKGIVSGYWDPLHRGHLEYIHAAKLRCEFLIAIVNNDEQLRLKKTKPFMTEDHRCFIINALRDVDQVELSIDTDKTICNTLADMRRKHPNDALTFFNSGDRVSLENTVISELDVCEKFNIKYVAIPLPKRYSSTELLKSVCQ